MTKQEDTVVAVLAAGLRRHRQDHKYTQESLSEAVGLRRNAIALIERGRANPLLSTLESLAKALDIDIRDLFLADGAPAFSRSDQPALVRAGGNVARLRKKIGKRGLSQENLSKLSGHFRTYVTELEMGRASPSLADLESIAGQIGAQVVDLLEPLEEAAFLMYSERFEKSRRGIDSSAPSKSAESEASSPKHNGTASASSPKKRKLGSSTK
jgi:transcriptional regulator with XRE-family HTH domain